jgi:thioredoxin reductase (NADPH)
MAEAGLPLQPSLLSPDERTFPRLTPEQCARAATHGSARRVDRGEVLVEAGEALVPWFVLTAGRLEIVRPCDGTETLVAVLDPGQFTGEVNTLSGRRALVQIRATEPGEVIEVDHDRLLALVQTDSELSDILMRAFILRRVELIAHGIGDVVVVGSSFCSATLRVREFLSRNAHPFIYLDLEHYDGVQELLDRFEVGHEDLPVLICRGELVLRNPTDREIADCLGFNEAIDPAQVRDLVVVGAGPAGLAAAVYGASEGLDVLVLESASPGGQAGTSSKIENYLGFPTGISGLELTGRAYTQAQKFGAELMVARGVRRLACGGRSYTLEIDAGPRVPARCVIIASGAAYRKLPLPGLVRFEGAGVYYAATFMEAQLAAGEEVIVVGAGNSAGQAAVFLARTAARVHLAIRSDDLGRKMSRYLVRRIEQDPSITLHTRTEIEALEGDGHLERVRWRSAATGETEERAIRHLFVMTGADPNTGWLDGCVALDAGGFVKTGPELTAEDLEAAGWPLARRPYLLETSRPGVFAAGDVRCGNVKRVASAVGEGSIAVAFVHRALQE